MDDGYSMGIVHVNPEISSTENKYKQSYVVSDSQNYGSLGFTLDSESEYPVSVDFVYPSTETPISYDAASATRRYHKITEGNEHSYTLGIIPQKSELYNDAMVDTYLTAISLETIKTAEVDLDAVYELNMELYDELYVYYEGADGKYSSGMPFAVNVKDFDDFYAVSFQMGFIGAQTTIAAELIWDGILYEDGNALKMGQEILNLWTADYVYESVLPPSWWQPVNGGNAGASTGYPSFLRCFVDGAEGILNACIYAKETNLDYSKWEDVVLKIADFLVENQNDDGSYYRAYNVDGTVCTDISSDAYQGTSKLNTPVAVRFLCSMYDYTNDTKYRDAVIKAADYCYEDTYDFAVSYSSTSVYDKLNIFKEGNTAGWSMIANGHSAIDVFGASAYYELFKQYLRSGNEAYQMVAGLL